LSRNKKPRRPHVSEHRLYDNCMILAPDGQLLARCNERKIKWYHDRGLADLLPGEPKSIRLRFEPKGRAFAENDPSFLAEHANRCVVCGGEADLTRHHIIPYCFRKNMPLELKSHCSFDVVPLCVEHHISYEEEAQKLKEKLSKDLGVSLNHERIKYHKDIGKVVGHARTLLRNSPEVPASRKEELRASVAEYLGRDPSPEDLAKVASLNPYEELSVRREHMEVMKRTTDLQGFFQMWRQHFVDVMRPGFMPAYWRVDAPITVRSRQ